MRAERLGAGRDRVPSEHPEGYLEAFTTLYRETAAQIVAGPGHTGDVPDVDHGVTGLRFIDAMMESHRQGSRWVNLSNRNS